ncbi:MAG: SusC/RagA family TonB-linked outer membrane protein [Prevotella sp.]|nr:SusC/RagA family TonB-linked outer membrane protein [Prevotella sp.]
MVKRLRMFLAALLLSVAGATAQTQVSGTVVSQDDGEPVVGASIQIIGTNQGTTTDADGKFSLSVPKGAKLRVSYLGMEQQDLAARDGMQIVMVPDDKTLNEVVVTALGIKRSTKALGYAAASVKGEDLALARTNDIMSSLAGKMAGVQINTTSSDPGASQSVIIRGVSSLSGNNQPLYVIDGVPLNNTSVRTGDGLNSGYDFGNGAGAVNPDDVESMTVLKGAAATALYGSRAANGVILITTKSGKDQKKGVGVEYNGGLQWEGVLRLPQMQNDFGQGWYGSKTMDENGSWGPRFDGSFLRYGQVYNNSQQRKSYVAIPSNVQDFFDTGVRYNNSVSFNGATDRSTYFVSLSQIHEDGIIPTDADSYKKYTFSARGSHKIKNVTLSTSLNYAYQQNDFVTTGQGNGSMYNAIMQTPRDISIAELKDLSNPFASPGYYYTPYGVTNPYYILENFMNNYESERFYGKLQLDYDFLKYFRLTYRFGLDTSTGHRRTGQPNLEVLFAGTPNGDDLTGENGSTSQQMTRRREINHDLMVTFDKNLMEDLHVNALAGFNGNERSYKSLYGAVDNLTIPTWYNLSNSSEIPSTSQNEWLRRLMGVYGQAEFAWRDMVYLTLTARNDWSSTLPSGNRSFFYPGVTASWLFSEILPENVKKIVSFGKLRAAWGKTGNDADVYMTNSVYGQASTNSSGWASSAFPFSKTNTNAYTAGNTLGSNTLSPEMSTESEIGLNMAFLKNRISFDFSYYNRVSDKQIFQLELDPASGYTLVNTNIGKVRNRGIEFLLDVTPVKIKDFQWDLHFNYTKNNNEVLSLPAEMGGESNIYGFSGGTGLYAIEGKELGIFKAYTSQKDEKGNVIVNPSTGLPITTDDVVEIGSMQHKYQMGFGTTLKYKGVSLAVNFDYRKGGLMFSRTKDIAYFTGNAIQTAYNGRNPWVIPGSVYASTDNAGNTVYLPNTTPLTPTDIYNYWDKGANELDAAFLVDKTYLKLRSVVLSWELPRKWFDSFFITGASVSFFGNNLFLWTPKSNTFIDPESTSFGNDLQGNFGEYSANPSSRKFGFNVNVKF